MTEGLLAAEPLLRLGDRHLFGRVWPKPVGEWRPSLEPPEPREQQGQPGQERHEGSTDQRHAHLEIVP